MKSFFLACCLLVAAILPVADAAAVSQADPRLVKQVNDFVDSWHDDAAHGRQAYFDKIAADGVYIGTDRSELWKRDAFKEWAKGYFQDNKPAWTFRATRRNVYASPDGSIIWFDELLDTENMGHCMASGVIRKTAKGFEIVHYQLSIAVPNQIANQVTGLVKAAEAGAAGAK
ncbi:nuclear transport factor 2 family protein [Massilia sp. YIM B02763]|uniref:nuclear transport factor 2 family protein n=1 Tax=Massilia sp. YIM B02763 TaxID=3050130 RepID=UPI0025B632EC|nr:nuclear transport factor 2 family protein [Massilia sp. YIM B02763]MDN4055555.1 nuclear transport factor 2 family protein [Massilia sp. YIM B02763]